MKKRLLFVMPSLSVGGGEKSLVNLLAQIDYELFEVDLFLFEQKGLFINSLPKEVKLVSLPENYIIFSKGLFQSLKHFFKKGNYKLAYSRLMFSIINRINKNTSVSEQKNWAYFNKFFNVLEKEYDVGIGYLEKSSIYFVVDKVLSKKKIGWIHTNYDNSGMSSEFDFSYFNKLDQLVTVSEECAISLKRNFKQLSAKIMVIYNVVSPEILNKLSENKIVETRLFDENYINIVTVARLSHEKGIDLAIESCKLLLERGYKVKWFVLGEGNERKKLEYLIDLYGLKNHFKLLGIRENPYPYIKKADLYIQPSRYEGRSISIDEAKILRKPIIVTKFETAEDQINNGINGMIVEMTKEGITEGVEYLLNNSVIKNTFVQTLSNEKLGTEGEIIKFYGVIKRCCI